MKTTKYWIGPRGIYYKKEFEYTSDVLKSYKDGKYIEITKEKYEEYKLEGRITDRASKVNKITILIDNYHTLFEDLISYVERKEPEVGSNLRAKYMVVKDELNDAEEKIIFEDKPNIVFSQNFLSYANELFSYLTKEKQDKVNNLLNTISLIDPTYPLGFLSSKSKYNKAMAYDATNPDNITAPSARPKGKEADIEGWKLNNNANVPSTPSTGIPANFKFSGTHPTEGSFIEIDDPNSSDKTRYYQHKVEGTWKGTHFLFTYPDTSQDPLATIAYVKGLLNSFKSHVLSKEEGISLEQTIMNWTQQKIDALKLPNDSTLPDYSNLKINGTLYNKAKNKKAFIFKGTIFHEPYVHGNIITFHSLSFKAGKIVGSMLRLVKGSSSSIVVNTTETGGASMKNLEDLEHKLTTLIRQHISAAKTWRLTFPKINPGRTEWLSLTPPNADFSNIVGVSAFLDFGEKQRTLSGVFQNAIQGQDRAKWFIMDQDESKEVQVLDKQHSIKIKVSDEGEIYTDIQTGVALKTKAVMDLTISGII